MSKSLPHICLIAGPYNRYDVLIYEKQAKTLVTNGFRVSIVVSDTKGNEIKSGVSIISTGRDCQSRLSRCFGNQALLKTLLSINADVYQLCCPEMISLVDELKFRGKYVLFNLREFYPDMILSKHYIPRPLRKLTAIIYSNIMRKKLPRYDAVFTVTDWIVDKLKKDYNVERCYLLANFPVIDNNFYLSEEEYIKRKDTLFYEGTIYSTSRQENVFAALEHIGKVSYLIAGKIDEKYDIIKNHPYWNNVTFIDGFRYEELPGFFSKVTIGNVFRDFGKRDGSLGVLKVFECMSAALPVLFSDVPLYRKINEKYHCGLCVNPNSIDSIEYAIRYLIEHKKEAYEMGQNGRRAVIEEFSWDSQKIKYLKIIEDLVIS